MDNINFLTTSEIEKLSPEDKQAYFNMIKEYCQTLKFTQRGFNGQKFIEKVYPKVRSYPLYVEGIENIPEDEHPLYVVNHSSSHDIFTGYEVLSKVGQKGSVMVASDCLSPIIIGLFKASNATLFDRNDSEASKNSLYELSSKMLSGNSGLIFSESTWNLHPVKPMQNIKIGAAKIGAITASPIIPTIMEYIEKPEMVEKESDLIEKCIVRFGKPIRINPEESLIAQTLELQKALEILRRKIWIEQGIDRETLSDVDIDMYLNHTYAKKFEALGFTYDSEKESKFLRPNKDGIIENEFHLDEQGNFTPGITYKRR